MLMCLFTDKSGAGLRLAGEAITSASPGSATKSYSHRTELFLSRSGPEVRWNSEEIKDVQKIIKQTASHHHLSRVPNWIYEDKFKPIAHYYNRSHAATHNSGTISLLVTDSGDGISIVIVHQIEAEAESKAELQKCTPLWTEVVHEMKSRYNVISR